MRKYLVNFRDNLLFCISAIAFAVMNNSGDIVGILTVLMSCLATIVVASYKSHIFSSVIRCNKVVLILAGMGALGICLVNKSELYYCFLRNGWNIFGLDTSAHAEMYSNIIAIVSVYFVFVLLAVFYEKTFNLLKTYFGDISRSDIITMLGIFVVLSSVVFVSFRSSNAFYGGSIPYDIIYSTDSPSLLDGNVYLWITHYANDIRQPFFGIFAAPFIAPLYFITLPLHSISCYIVPFIMQIVQIALLIFAFYMISKMLHVSQIIRVLFLIICSSTYMVLLFSLAMEQYIMGFFWLVLCFFIVCETKEQRVVAYTGALGSLMTSAIIFPLLSDENIWKNWKKWIKDMVIAALTVIFAFLFLGRFDILYSAIERLVYLSEFTGRVLTLKDRLWQYWAFVQNCFITPRAGYDDITRGHISWQLNWITEIYWVGVFLFICCIIGFILNRKDKFTQISFAWVIYSLIVLVLIGWGTIENCLLLYSLYFGWAFLVLLYKLLASIIKEKAMPYVLVTVAIVLLLINIPGIKLVIDFAIQYYPI